MQPMTQVLPPEHAVRWFALNTVSGSQKEAVRRDERTGTVGPRAQKFARPL